MVAGLPGSGPTPPPAAPPSPLLRLFRTSAADLQAMVDALLSSKEYDALVMDETALDGVDSLNCDTTLVGGAFDTLPQSAVWPVKFDRKTADNALLKLE